MHAAAEVVEVTFLGSVILLADAAVRSWGDDAWGPLCAD